MSSLHQRAKELFLQALTVPAAGRQAYVAEACGADTALHDEVNSLLAFHEETDSAEVLPPEASRPDPPEFAPGTVFANRYRMVTRIGRGGMGDVWHADDLVLEAPVALKLIHSAGPDARVRILNEVRLARRITHPAVCRVFDFGEAEGEVFYSMELVDGEDLATVLKRVGRLPSEKVIDIAHQLCAGLAAAHAQRVLHRDLKPANVLIDNDGRVRITDFGIAITGAAVGARALAGTPGYMAPEQFEASAELSERTDVYALGVVLYELLTGQHPFDRPGTGIPALPSKLVTDVSPHLERVILQALASDPSQRPASASAMAARLPPPSAAGRRLNARVWIAGAATAAVVLLAVFSLRFSPRGASALTAQDTIVIADFVNTTGEAVFDGTLKVALAVALEQSPFIKVFPDERVDETLRLMARAPGEPITRSVAREIAQREQLKALIAGSIGTIGKNYVVALEAVNTETGDVMARQQVEVPTKEQVLTSLGGAASRLRERLGESLASIQKFDVALPKATTPSLEALHAYALALDEGRVNPRLEAIPQLKRAIELDPDFALAHAQLATVYANTGQTSLAPEHARKAFELRDRVSERERFFITFRYYRDATQAWDQGLELTKTWTAMYPREAFAFNSLGTGYSRFAQYDRAIEAFERGIELDPKFGPLYANLASVLVVLNRFDDAQRVVDRGMAERIDLNVIRRMAFLLAFLRGDTAAMARQVEASVGVGQNNAAYGWQAHVLAFSGRVKEAHELFNHAAQLALGGGFSEVAGQLSVEDAEAHAIVGQCTEARHEIAAALQLTRDNYSLERAARALAICGADREAAGLASELETRFADATLTIRLSVPLVAASTAVRRGDAARAIELLDALRPLDRVPKAEYWPEYLRGVAYLRSKSADKARVEFQSILDHRGEFSYSQLYPLAYLGLARAAALGGDAEQSRAAYENVLTLWKDADSDLQPLHEARREYARLGDR